MANVTGPEEFASKYRDNIRLTPLFGQIQYIFIPPRLSAARLASKRVTNSKVFLSNLQIRTHSLPMEIIFKI